MDKRKQVFGVSAHLRWQYGLGALGLGALLFFALLTFNGVAARKLAAPAAPIMSSVTSIDEPNNTLGQAVAGELVTVTAVFNVPAGDVIHNALPRVVLQDGLYPIGASHAYTLYTGTRDQLRAIEGAGNVVWYPGALLVFSNQGTITGTDVFTMTVYAVRRQKTYVGTPADIGNVNLRVQGILRYCTGDPSCTPTLVVNTPVNDIAGQVQAILPQVGTNYPVAAAYLDPANAITGGSRVRLTFRATGASGRPTAHDIVYTVTLGSGLSHFDSHGDNVGPGNVSIVDGVTYVAWNVPVSLAAGETWNAVVTATLPNPMVIGSRFTYLGTATYETFAGDVDDEGRYTQAGTSQTLTPVSLLVTKSSVPSSGAVTMGDNVTYTVVIRQAANTILNAPQVVDTQPLGFHYITDTFDVQGANATPLTLSQGTAEGTGVNLRHYEDLNWAMDDLPAVSTTRWVTATYVTLNNGLDYNGLLVWASDAEVSANKATISGGKTGVVLSWTPPAGSPYSSAPRVNAGALGVIQPYMKDKFTTGLTNVGPFEVGAGVGLAVRFHNFGALVSGKSIPAYELQVCDTLPTGLVFAQAEGCFENGTATQCPFKDDVVWPEVGDEGVICWQIPVLERTTPVYEFKYRANVTASVIPGVQSTRAFVSTYSTQEGEGEGERVYSDSQFPGVMPSASASFTVLGLEATKTPWQTVVEPGDYITYTLAYTDSSATPVYTDVIIIDTYDTYLIYRGATPEPDEVDTQNRRLVWNIGDVANTSGQIILTMQVQSPLPDGVITLTNKMQWDSYQTPVPPREQVVVTPLDVANLEVAISAPEFTHADDVFVYTVAYTNVGPTNREVTLTFAYDPDLIFVAVAGDAAQWNGSDHIFTGVAPANTPREMQVTVRVNAPLHYMVSELETEVELASAGATSKYDSVVVEVLRPQMVMLKTSTSKTAPDAGNPVLYNFMVQNTGNFTATGCVIIDAWDGSKLSYLSGGGEWTDIGSAQATWSHNPFTLAPSGIVTPSELVLQVDVDADHYENYLHISCDQIGEVPPFKHDLWKASIETSKTANDVIAFPGRIVTYTLTYKTEHAVVQNAVITDHLPAGITLIDYSKNIPVGCTNFTHNAQPGIGGGTDVYWHCGFLSMGAVGTVQVWGTVSGAEGHTITNTTASGGDSPVPYRPGTVEVPLLVSRPRLSLTQTLEVVYPEYSNVAPNDLVIYKLAYRNRGTATANEVIFKVHLPTAQVDFVSATAGGVETGGVVVWEVGDVRAGRGGEVYLTVRAKNVPGASVMFEAGDLEIASLRINDTQPDNETEYFYPVVVTINDPDLKVVKSYSAPSLALNALITYTIDLENIGGGALTQVVFTDTLADYLTIVNAPNCVHSLGSIPASDAGGTLTCTVGTLTQHTPTSTVQLVTRLSSVLPENQYFSNVAWGYSDQTPSEPSNVVYVGGDAPYNLTLEPTVQTGNPPYVAPKQVYFNLAADGTAPIDFVITFGNGGSASGTLPSNTVNTTYNMSGTYTVIMTATNMFGSAVKTYPVTVTGSPVLQVSPLAITVDLAEGDQTTRPLTITNAVNATDVLNWQLAESVGWLTPDAIVGTLAPGDGAVVTLTFNATGLTPGESYPTTLIVSGVGTPVNVSVFLRIAKTDNYIYLPLVLRN